MKTSVTTWWQATNARLVAPLWHLALFLPLLLMPWHIWELIKLFPDLNAFAMAHEQIARWIVTASQQWTLVAFIWLGLWIKGVRMRDLIGGRWSTRKDFFRDLGLGCGFMFVSAGIYGALYLLLKPTLTEAHTAQFAMPNPLYS